ncbi:HsdR family type I site-specific deoxyribonuclease [Prevotella copri]|uniref:type I restriction endonuclease subunit R n=1 Tax=Segatella copri TaxID=165179 RepID=UPI001C3827E1|nr:HsdR family type I site-specific deoxyribonuclease [Segatella copri]MBV3430774.1 HsdR family type I site-specific deoxyribonuclease [Segatella copri]
MDSHIGEPERPVQNRLLALFKEKLKYEYLGNYEYRTCNRNIERKLLFDYLMSTKKWSKDEAKRAITKLEKEAYCTPQNMQEKNEKVYSLLRYGVNVSPDVGTKKITVNLIDWEHPDKNQFYIAEEVTINSSTPDSFTKRPDLVIYVNGIALAVIELKRSKVSVHDGIRQTIGNQQENFIRPFFSTVQLLFAGNDSQGLYYGVIDTPEKFWLRWKKPDASIPNELDRSVTQWFNKERLLEMIHDFLVFDAGVKKVCRPNQYFAVKAAQPRCKKKEGGVIWEAQGSGKSLIMVWLAEWIHENIDNSRVVIITDREELDEQISDGFKDTGETIARAKSGAGLIGMLNEEAPWLLCTLIHKFGKKNVEGKGDMAGVKSEIPLEKYLEDIVAQLPQGFKAKGNIFVFIDECHRTQGGYLHEAMKTIMGKDVMMIGFTGTPLLHTQKKDTWQTFGPLIHAYRFNEAVEDGVILDLRYESRKVDQFLGNKDKIDAWFEKKTKGLNKVAAARLKGRWATMQNIFSSRQRIDAVVGDICLDMDTTPMLVNRRGNAILVADSIYQACRYWDAFQKTALKGHCAVITSFEAKADDINMASSGENESEDEYKYRIYKEMTDGHKSVSAFEAYAKKEFIDHPKNMRLLIVVDKLLTGFDAPSACVLYIDKHMENHNLFQAICRVNRVDGDDKEYGYIVDYQNLFECISGAIGDYTSDGAALSGYDKDDIEGYIKEKNKACRKDLEEAKEQVEALLALVHPQTREGFFRYFVYDDNAPEEEMDKQLDDNAEKRSKLYKYVRCYLNCYANLANSLEDMGYSEAERKEYAECAKKYDALKREIELRSNDHIDMRRYEPDMRQVLDLYVKAEDSEVIAKLDDTSFLDILAAQNEEQLNDLPDELKDEYGRASAETVEANLREVIRKDSPFNPAYYGKLSIILQELIDKRKKEMLDYEEYMKELIELVKKARGKSANSYPESIKTPGMRALYDNLGQNEYLTIRAHEVIKENALIGFRDNRLKQRKLIKALAKLLGDEMAQKIYDIIKLHDEYGKGYC